MQIGVALLTWVLLSFPLGALVGRFLRGLPSTAFDLSPSTERSDLNTFWDVYDLSVEGERAHDTATSLRLSLMRARSPGRPDGTLSGLHR